MSSKGDIMPAMHMIVVMDYIINCHWPQAGTSHVWPLDCSMNHDGSGVCHHGSNGSFSNPILMVGANTTEFYVL